MASAEQVPVPVRVYPDAGHGMDPEQELQKVANEKANIMRQLEETKTNCQAEAARFDAEITRLGTLTSTFGTGQ